MQNEARPGPDEMDQTPHDRSTHDHPVVEPVDALALLGGLLRDAELLAARHIAKPTDMDIAMRLGAGHQRGPFETIADLGREKAASLGLRWQPDPGVVGTAPDPERGREHNAADTLWAGPVGLAGAGHMARGIAEAVARSGRDVAVLARSESSGSRLTTGVAGSLDRSVTRGRIDAAEP